MDSLVDKPVTMRLWMLTFLFCCNITGSLRLPNLRLIQNCPSSYKIQEGGSNTLQIEVKNITNACERIPPLAEGETYPTVNELSPEMTIGSHGDKKVVNISWTSTIIRNKHPKMYLLELTKYNRYGDFLSTSCVLLRLRNRKVENSKNPLTLFFDCVELVPEKGIYLSVQVWCLPDSHSAMKSCQSRRHKRSLPPSKTCRYIRGQVQCSEEKLFLLSLDDRIPGICHCSDPPNLSLTRLQNGSLRIDTWNLPQYAYMIEFYIYKESKEVYKRNLTGTTRFNESRSVITDKIFGPGNYTPVVYAACAGDREAIRLAGYSCQKMNMVQLDIPLEVPYPITTKPPEFKPAIHTLIPILGAVVLSCLVTVIVFCVLIKRRKNTPGTQTGMSPDPLLPISHRNNEFESRYLQLAKLNSEKMLIFHPDNELHLKCIRELQIMSKSFGFTLVTDTTIDTNTAIITDNNAIVDTADNMHTTSNTSTKVLNTENTDIIDDTTTNINPNVNWRDFAEMAGTEHTEIVIIMSAGLLQICRAFHNRRSDKEDFDILRRERHYELIPCVVLQKLQTLIQENSPNCDFSVHFVTFGMDSSLIEDFLNTFDFLKRGSNYFIYCLSEFYKDESHHENSVRLNKTDFKELFRRLKGMTEYEMGYTVIDSAISNQNFGTELSQVLSQTLAFHRNAIDQS